MTTALWRRDVSPFTKTINTNQCYRCLFCTKHSLSGITGKVCTGWEFFWIFGKREGTGKVKGKFSPMGLEFPSKFLSRVNFSLDPVVYHTFERKLLFFLYFLSIMISGTGQEISISCWDSCPVQTLVTGRSSIHLSSGVNFFVKKNPHIFIKHHIKTYFLTKRLIFCHQSNFCLPKYRKFLITNQLQASFSTGLQLTQWSWIGVPQKLGFVELLSKS